MAYNPEKPLLSLETLGHVGEGFDYSAESPVQFYGYATSDDPAVVESAGYFPTPAKQGPALARGDWIMATMRKGKGLSPSMRLYGVVEGTRSGDPANVIALIAG